MAVYIHTGFIQHTCIEMWVCVITQLWKAFVEWLSIFKRRSVDDDMMILDYNRETYELEAVCEMGSGDEEEDLKISEEPPTYGI